MQAREGRSSVGANVDQSLHGIHAALRQTRADTTVHQLSWRRPISAQTRYIQRVSARCMIVHILPGTKRTSHSADFDTKIKTNSGNRRYLQVCIVIIVQEYHHHHHHVRSLRVVIRNQTYKTLHTMYKMEKEHKSTNAVTSGNRPIQAYIGIGLYRPRRVCDLLAFIAWRECIGYTLSAKHVFVCMAIGSFNAYTLNIPHHVVQCTSHNKLKINTEITRNAEEHKICPHRRWIGYTLISYRNCAKHMHEAILDHYCSVFSMHIYACILPSLSLSFCLQYFLSIKCMGLQSPKILKYIHGFCIFINKKLVYAQPIASTTMQNNVNPL